MRSRVLDELHEIRAKKAGIDIDEILAECKAARERYLKPRTKRKARFVKSR